MTEYTPGPWAVCTDAIGDTFIASMTDSAETVCELGSGQDDEDQSRLDADARLIAAAPDLLDAAPEAADILEHYAEYVRGLPSAEFDRHPYIPAIEEAAAKLRAAIAKARGEA